MSSYTLTKQELTALKRELTIAQNSGDYEKIKAAVIHAHNVFDKKGYPDCWGDWDRALDDAYWTFLAS